MAERNFENRTLYHGDNLAFLRGMNTGTVNLIATDPPFNKSKDFHATPDSLASGASFQDRWSWHDDIHDDWLTAIMRDEPEVWSVINTAKQVYGDDMGAFLCWLGVRLLEMHRILADDGSIYLHIDHTAHAYVKALMDAVFGKANFRNEVVWRSTTAHSDANRFGMNTEILLFYSKGDGWTWNQLYEPYDDAYKARFRFKDTDGRLWQDDNLTAKGLSGGGYTYEYKGKTELWRVPLETMERLDAEGRLHITKRGGIRRKRYLDESEGRPLQQLWADINPINSQAKERTGFPTQKPLALYERIIKASSNPGDMVLDPFCGCATTPVAAERQGREWVGMDIWDGAHDQVLARLEKENLAVRGRRPRARVGAGKGGGEAGLLTFGDITYSTTPPKRTDDGEPATLVLRTPTGRAPRYPAPRTQHSKLLADIGAFCQGCGADYQFDSRVLEVDHINPRSQDGTDAYENLTLLCPPCNKEKRDRYTLIGLQDYNRKAGYMKNEAKIWTRRASGARRGRRR